jgi:hypothetical protein
MRARSIICFSFSLATGVWSYACSSTSATPNGQVDAGTADASPGVDGGVACTPKSGFETAVKLGAVGSEYAHESMVLGANDEPMIAFIAYGDDRAASFLYFVSYDPATCSWRAPVKIDQVYDVNDNPTLREVTLTRDPVSGQLGIAYYVMSPTGSPSGDTLVMLAQSSDGGATWTKEQVAHDDLVPDDNDAHSLAFPAVAMANGRTVFAYYRNYSLQGSCGDAKSYCNGWTVLTRTGTTGPFAGGAVTASSAFPGGESMSAALAIDPTGQKAGLAWYSRNSDEDPTLVVNYLEVGQTHAVKVFDSAGKGNDQPAIALAFDRSQPRIAAALERTADDTGSAIWFSSSSDGTTWTAPAELPTDKGDDMSSYLAIAADQKGALTIAVDFDGSHDEHGDCGGPKLVTTSDLTAFATCGADPDPAHPVGFAGIYVTAAYAKSGKRVLAFDYPTASAGLEAGVVTWREP